MQPDSPENLIIHLPRVHLNILKDDTRFQVLCAGRGFAKTGVLLAKGALNLQKQYSTPTGQILPNRIMYAAPTIGEARDIAWERAKELFEPFTVHKPNEQRLEIKLINNAVFFLRGLKKLNRIRGDYLTCFLADEFAFAQPDGATIETMWQQVIRPMLGKTHPGGEAMFASTPDGHNYFYQLFQRGNSLQIESAIARRCDSTDVAIPLQSNLSLDLIPSPATAGEGAVVDEPAANQYECGWGRESTARGFV